MNTHKKDQEVHDEKETTIPMRLSISKEPKDNLKDECNESNTHEEEKANDKVQKSQRDDEREKGREHEQERSKGTKSTNILPPTSSLLGESNKENIGSEFSSGQKTTDHEPAISSKERKDSSSINSRASNMFDLNSESCVSTVDYAANKETGPSYTRILDKFKDPSPKYKLLYQRDSILKELRIWKVTLKNDKEYVLKSIRVKKDSRSLIQSIINEYHIGRTLGALSPNVIKTLDFQQETLDNEEVVIEILMEYGGVALTSLKNRLNHITVLRMIYELLNLFELMEKLGVAHFDIKPQNIVWDQKSKKVKLIDFGTSITFYNNPDEVKEPMIKNYSKIIGFTRFYAPFELIQKNYKKIIPQKVDVYSFGVTMVEMILMNAKGYNTKNSNISYNIIVSIREMLDYIKKEAYSQLIRECLHNNPLKRPSFTKLKREFIDIMKSLECFSDIHEKKEKCGVEEYYKRGTEFLHLGEYIPAIWWFNKYLEKWNCRDRRAGYIKLGLAYEEFGNYRKAIECYKRAEELSKNESNIELGKLYTNLCSAYTKCELYDKADYYSKRTEELYSSLKFKMHTIDCLNKASYLYLNKAEHKNAIDGSEKVIKIVKVYNNTEISTVVAVGYNNMGLAYLCGGENSKAQEYAHKAISILSEDSSPEINNSCNIVGQICRLLKLLIDLIH